MAIFTRIFLIPLSALDEASIRKGLASLQPNESTYSLYLSGLGRQRADWLIGMNMTMATTALFGVPGEGALSVGRVQTPTLALIVARDHLIEHFQASPYYELHVTFQAKAGKLVAHWQPAEEFTDTEGRCVNPAFVQAVIEKVANQTGEVTQAKDTAKKQPPPLCYSLSSLQKVCSSRFGLTAKDTLSIAQALYEKHKATTYPRTDTGYLPEEQWGEASTVLAALEQVDSAVAQWVARCDASLKAPVWNTQKVTAHHGLMPTANDRVNLAAMSGDERKVYELIRQSYLAQFLGEYDYVQRKVVIECQGETFSAQCHIPQTQGWKALVQEESDTPDHSTARLPKLTAQESGTVLSCEQSDKQTKPPARFTEGTLIAGMKSIAKVVDDLALKKTLKDTAGIGTEATRADIIEKLLTRGFIERNKKQLVSTTKGRDLIALLPDPVKNPATTAEWEQALDDIAQGQGCLGEFLEDQAEVLDFLLADLQEHHRLHPPADQATPQACPSCQAPLRRRKGKKGFFWGCSRYPECDLTLPDKDGQPVNKPKAKVSDISCPHCKEGKLVRRQGKKKPFWGCNRYPTCEALYWEEQGKPLLPTRSVSEEDA